MIGARADEAAEALFEFNDGFWKLVVAERVATGGADGVEAGLEERMVGHGERQLGDDYGLERVAGHVDALPETIGTEEYGSRVGFELFEQLRALDSIGLAQQAQVARSEPALQAGRHTAKHIVTGEEHECVTIGEARIMLDGFDASLFVGTALSGGWIRHVAKRDEFSLLAVIEGAADLDRVALRQTDARLEECKRV